MPLFWSTDKIIAGKYRIKKPIPIKNIGYTKWLGGGPLKINGQKLAEITFDISILNKSFEVIDFNEFEEVVIDEIEQVIKGIFGQIDDDDDEFYYQIGKDYLEEIN